MCRRHPLQQSVSISYVARRHLLQQTGISYVAMQKKTLDVLYVSFGAVKCLFCIKAEHQNTTMYMQWYNHEHNRQIMSTMCKHIIGTTYNNNKIG